LQARNWPPASTWNVLIVDRRLVELLLRLLRPLGELLLRLRRKLLLRLLRLRLAELESI
jgi:hypothetical protein